MKWRALSIAVAALVIASALAWILLTGSPPSESELNESTIIDPPTPTPAPEQRIVLLFAGFDGMLHPELRSVPLPDEVQERVQIVVRELLLGPQTELQPITPYPVDLLGTFLDGKGHAFIDLTPPPAPVEGSNTELLFAYGIIDTVLLNCSELNGVQLLFGGQEVATLSGHLDLSRPLTLNKRFIAAS